MKPQTRRQIILYAVIAILLAIIVVQCSKQPDVVKVPVKIEVPIPVVEVEFDTIKNPYPVYLPGKVKIDSTYYKMYVSLKDSVARDSLFKDAITIREYRERQEDDTIVIDVYSKVQGFLKEQQVSYKTKPRKISLDTVLEVKTKYQPKFGVGMELGAPITKEFYQNIVFKPKVVLDTKNMIYEGSFDTEKRAWLGIVFKF